MLKTGLTHTSTMVVGESHTALALGSGDLRVLATPAMIALMEHAAMKAVAESLPEGCTTVGFTMECKHLKPTPEGALVSATATLAEADGRKLRFDIVARDDNGAIGEASHTRYIVDREKFMSKIP